MRILLLLVAILLSGCMESFEIEDRPAPPSEPEDIKRLNEVFEYVDDFYDRLYFYTQSDIMVAIMAWPFSVPAYMDDLPKGMAASCHIKNDGEYRYISFDRDTWDKIGPLQKRELVFHELGHCVLDRAHRCSNFGQYDLPSIMSPVGHHDSFLEIPLEEDPQNYWEESRFNQMELELFDSKYIDINNCDM